MSEVNDDSVVDENVDNVQEETDQNEESVETVQNQPKDRYKEDLLKSKDTIKELESKIQALEQSKEQERISKMKEQERFKELAEEYEAKAKQAEQEKNSLRNAVVMDKKLSAVKQEALKLGIRKEALDDLDMISMDTIEIETTSTGRVNVLNAKAFAENLKLQKPHWFGRRSASFSSDEPEVTPMGAVTLEMIKKAEREYKKTGDSTKYQTLLMKYKQQ